MYSECVFALIFSILVWLFIQRKKSRRAPPGPWAFPLIGNMLDFVVGGDPVNTLCRWAVKYGPVYSYMIGSQKIVVITEPKLVKQLFSKEVASGRPQNSFWQSYTNYHGVVTSDGPKWETQHRFLIKTLKMFGFGKASILECRLLEEYKGLACVLEKNVGIPIIGNGLFFPFLTGTVWGLMASDINENEKHQVVDLVNSFMSGLNAVAESGVMYFPALRYLAPDSLGWTKVQSSITAFREFVIKRIDKNRAELDPSNPTGFIDHFLIEMESAADATSTFYKESGYNNLLAVVSDMFVASIDTTGKTLEWAMLYLSKQIDIQEKLQQELDNVIGKSRSPYLSDRPLLPYTEAVILEILRLSSIGPMGFPHRLLGNIEFHGYLLEKDCILMPSLYTIHRDPSLWGVDAEEFNPERFMNGNKTKVIRNESLIPFSVGKRKCLGENVAMDTLFLFVTCIFQNFTIKPDPDCCEPDLSSEPGVIVSPKPFRLVVYPRE